VDGGTFTETPCTARKSEWDELIETTTSNEERGDYTSSNPRSQTRRYHPPIPGCTRNLGLVQNVHVPSSSGDLSDRLGHGKNGRQEKTSRRSLHIYHCGPRGAKGPRPISSCVSGLWQSPRHCTIPAAVDLPAFQDIYTATHSQSRILRLDCFFSRE
jgi:hypothetical protein